MLACAHSATRFQANLTCAHFYFHFPQFDLVWILIFFVCSHSAASTLLCSVRAFFLDVHTPNHTSNASVLMRILTFSACIFDLHTCLSTQKSQLTLGTALPFYLRSTCAAVDSAFLPSSLNIPFFFYIYFFLFLSLSLPLLLFLLRVSIMCVFCVGRALVGKTISVWIFIFTKHHQKILQFDK